MIAIGSNLAGPFGSPLASCRRAVACLAALPSLRLVGQSGWYDTEPVPKSMQPNFINGVATFAARGAPVDPAVLLGLLQGPEREAGRRRQAGAHATGPAARTLDLDIVAMGSLVRDGPDPVLPHPRAHERRFVLEPLREVLPGWRHPVLGREVDALLAGLPPGGALRLDAARLAAAGGD